MCWTLNDINRVHDCGEFGKYFDRIIFYSITHSRESEPCTLEHL